MPLAPAHIVSIALAFFGLGLIVAAFLGDSLAAMRLFGGLGLLVLAMIVSGLQLLTRHGAAVKEDT